MSPHQIRSFSKLSLPTTRAVEPITRSPHHMSTFTKATRALPSSDLAPLNPRLPTPKPLTSFLPKLSFHTTASGPAPPGVGPFLTKVISDPTFHKEADTDAKVVAEKAIAEEKLGMYFSGENVVQKGPLTALPAVARGDLPKEHTALWHVLNKDGRLYVVYVYAHAGWGIVVSDDAVAGV